MREHRKKDTLFIALLIANLVVTGFIIAYIFVPEGKVPSAGETISFDHYENGQYVLYIGLNDKDIYKQVIPTDEARIIVDEICAKHVDGWTVSTVNGGWTDEKGVLSQENTLVYTIVGVEEEAVVSIMDEVLIALNQNSIMLERRGTTVTFYP
ncbi:MAG: DUF3574 domain-containing protein [Clostridiales bacterium]|nr:DUF3574 domain-containing protein [Clostridiales bacterium]